MQVNKQSPPVVHADFGLVRIDKKRPLTNDTTVAPLLSAYSYDFEDFNDKLRSVSSYLPSACAPVLMFLDHQKL